MHLKFGVNLTFSLPNLVLVPLLSEVQEAVSRIRDELINITSSIYWWDASMKQKFTLAIQTDQQLLDIGSQIDKAIIGMWCINILEMRIAIKETNKERDGLAP